MNRVTSSDGTTIAFDRSGDGPPVILVCGQSTDRSSNAGVAALLAPDFTVFNYDRRGRGDSGDMPPYAVEVEDIDALIKEAGGSAFVYGMSSGRPSPSKPRRAVLPSRSWRSGSLRSSSAGASYRRKTWWSCTTR